MGVISSISIFLLSGILLYIAGELLVSGLLRLARYFRVTEFILAFFIMALAASLPNLFVGITSAMQSVPELSFGDIMGNNMIALTLAVSLGILFSPGRTLPLENKLIQDTSFLTFVAAILPLILISDGMISRSDGVVLLLLFFGYMYWLISKREMFHKEFQESKKAVSKNDALRNVAAVVLGIIILAIAAQGIVFAASEIAVRFGLPMIFIGVVIIGFGGALPEIYFTIVSARRGEDSLIVGNLMGAVIIPATLVLGIVALIHPISNTSLELPILARGAIIVAATIFFVAAQSKKEISIREATVLLVVYAFFMAHIVLTGVM
jgi:cation:H+ antiporter